MGHARNNQSWRTIIDVSSGIVYFPSIIGFDCVDPGLIMFTVVDTDRWVF